MTLVNYSDNMFSKKFKVYRRKFPETIFLFALEKLTL